MVHAGFEIGIENLHCAEGDRHLLTVHRVDSITVGVQDLDVKEVGLGDSLVFVAQIIDGGIHFLGGLLVHTGNRQSSPFGEHALRRTDGDLHAVDVLVLVEFRIGDL